MARFQILYHSEVARRDIPRLDPPIRRRIQTAIEDRLATRPEDFAKPLAYNRADLWSLRVGAWRVIFALRDDELGSFGSVIAARSTAPWIGSSLTTADLRGMPLFAPGEGSGPTVSSRRRPGRNSGRPTPPS